MKLGDPGVLFDHRPVVENEITKESAAVNYGANEE
jgi:hypothetical protein